MYAITFWFPIFLFILIIFGLFREDLTKLYSSRGIAVLAAFAVPAYPFLLLIIAQAALSISGAESEKLMFSVFLSSIVYYITAICGLIVYVQKSQYRGLGITGIVLSTLPGLAALFLISAIDGMKPF